MSEPPSEIAQPLSLRQSPGKTPWEPITRANLSVWDAVDRIGRLLGTVMIPLIGAWIGWLVHVSGTNAEYLKQAVTELTNKESDPALREWAVDVFVKTSPVPVSHELQNSLKQGKVSLQQPVAPKIRSGGDLVGVDLSGQDLSSLKLAEANLTGADLTHANLSHSDLSKAKLMNANLSSADLNGTDLSNASLDFADLSEATMTDANLQSARLLGSNLLGVDLSNARGLELDQLVSTFDIPDPTQHGVHRVGHRRLARWNSTTRFPSEISERLK